jgi:3-phytase
MPIAAATLLMTACAQSAADSPSSLAIAPALETAAVGSDADDPAVWVNPLDPARSLILGTDKAAAPSGGLYVFGLDGQVKQIVKPLDRPNNVDVEYGLSTPGGTIDIVVVTERLRHRLRVFQITATGVTSLDNDEGIPVLEGAPGEAGEPMGVGLYKRPADGAIFAIVAPKSGTNTDYLWQYRLTFDAASGRVSGTFVRRFGNYSGTAEIEAVAVDDALGYVYYSDEQYGIHKWHADPDDPEAGRELSVFGRTGFERDREGIAVVPHADGTGYIVVSDQLPNATRLLFYRREGHGGDPQQHEPAVAAITTSADSTDGLEVAQGVGGAFQDGLLVMMNSRRRNFQLYRWSDVEQQLRGARD